MGTDRLMTDGKNEICDGCERKFGEHTHFHIGVPVQQEGKGYLTDERFRSNKQPALAIISCTVDGMTVLMQGGAPKELVAYVSKCIGKAGVDPGTLRGVQAAYLVAKRVLKRLQERDALVCDSFGSWHYQEGSPWQR